MPHYSFVKMHGLGNDFVVFDSRGPQSAASPLTESQLRTHARLICDRRRGIGADQILWLKAVPDAAVSEGADFQMMILNADGSEAEMCGNGIRAVALLAGKPRIRVLTGAGIREVEEVSPAQYRVEMGIPVVKPDREGAWIINVGNPHWVIFCSSEEEARHRAASEGPRLEVDPRFPGRTNVEFVGPAGGSEGRDYPVHVWERGAGLTLACGTGACAAATALWSAGRAPLGQPLGIELPGGRLEISWQGPGKPLFMTGPAAEVYRGEIDFG